jgi:hypothetical protein
MQQPVSYATVCLKGVPVTCTMYTCLSMKLMYKAAWEVTEAITLAWQAHTCRDYSFFFQGS